MAITEPSKLELVVKTGMLRGRAYPLGAPARHLLLGRHRTCDIVFPADQQHLMVGRFHAVIESRPQGIFLINLHANGTFVNRTLIGEDGEISLGENDTVQLGEDGPVLSLGKVIVPAAPPPVPPPPLCPPSPPYPPAAERSSSSSSGGPSQNVQDLLHSFSKHLLALNDKMEEVRDGSVPAAEVLDQLEVIVSRLVDLRTALGIRSRS